jgi:catechol 2,3-dioxygenase-like lactoylglutathione lyase family enzyme
VEIIPILWCRDMAEAIHFYTQVLDFELKYSIASKDDWVIDLICGEAELMITKLEGDQKKNINVYIRVEDIDTRWNLYLDRGHRPMGAPNSPVHDGPIDQTWGMREFYINDPSGNTLRFGAEIQSS